MRTSTHSNMSKRYEAEIEEDNIDEDLEDNDEDDYKNMNQNQ